MGISKRTGSRDNYGVYWQVMRPVCSSVVIKLWDNHKGKPGMTVAKFMRLFKNLLSLFGYEHHIAALLEVEEKQWHQYPTEVSELATASKAGMTLLRTPYQACAWEVAGTRFLQLADAVEGLNYSAAACKEYKAVIWSGTIGTEAFKLPSPGPRGPGPRAPGFGPLLKCWYGLCQVECGKVVDALEAVTPGKTFIKRLSKNFWHGAEIKFEIRDSSQDFKWKLGLKMRHWLIERRAIPLFQWEFLLVPAVPDFEPSELEVGWGAPLCPRAQGSGPAARGTGHGARARGPGPGARGPSPGARGPNPGPVPGARGQRPHR